MKNHFLQKKKGYDHPQVYLPSREVEKISKTEKTRNSEYSVRNRRLDKYPFTRTKAYNNLKEKKERVESTS